MDEKNANEMKKIADNQMADVSSGYRGLFPKWQIIKTYCDFCNRKIDGKTLSAVPILGDKHMCNECFENQKRVLGEDAASEKWLGYKKGVQRTEMTVNTTSTTTNTNTNSYSYNKK